jgi:hypothetical protein
MTISTVGPVRITCSIFRYAPTAPRYWRDCELSPKPGWTRAIGAVDLLGHDALDTKPTSMLEDGRAISGDVFIEQDANLGIAQQPRQRGLAVKKRTVPQIISVMSGRRRRGSRYAQPLVGADPRIGTSRQALAQRPPHRS